jgi:hypothetical protein
MSNHSINKYENQFENENQNKNTKFNFSQYAFFNNLSEICAYMGEKPLDFLNKNIFYFNKKLEHRRIFFYKNEIMSKIKQISKEAKYIKIKEEIFEKIFSEIKNNFPKKKIFNILKSLKKNKKELNQKLFQRILIPNEEKVFLEENYNNIKLANYCLINFDELNFEEILMKFFDVIFDWNKNYIDIFVNEKNYDYHFSKLDISKIIIKEASNDESLYRFIYGNNDLAYRIFSLNYNEIKFKKHLDKKC